MVLDRLLVETSAELGCCGEVPLGIGVVAATDAVVDHLEGGPKPHHEHLRTGDSGLDSANAGDVAENARND